MYLSLDSHTHKSCQWDSWDAEGGELTEHQAGKNFTVSLKSCLSELDTFVNRASDKLEKVKLSRQISCEWTEAGIVRTVLCTKACACASVAAPPPAVTSASSGP